MKRLLSFVLVVVIVITSLPLTGFFAFAGKASAYAVGDIVEFGSYPQMEVTNNYVLNPLNSMNVSWKSFNYYSGDGDGESFSDDWMKYADVTYNGNRYRAVKFTKYRPGNTAFEALDYGYEDGNYYAQQDQNGYYTNTVYWFLYEPLEWVVLDSETGLVQCKTVIDNQPFSNTCFDEYSEYIDAVTRETMMSYKDEEQTIVANDYSQSDLRDWLNNDFYNTAFSSSDKSYINTTDLYTPNPYKQDMKYYYKTQDKVFLLSIDEESYNHYGLSFYTNREDHYKAPSDYAKVQGVSVTDDNYGNEIVWDYYVRSTGIRASFGQVCDYLKGIYSKVDVRALNGICPAIHLNKITGRCETNELGNKVIGDFFSGNKATDAEGKLIPAIDINWFDTDATTYNQNIARLCSIASLEGYQNKGNKNADSDLKQFLCSLNFNIATYAQEKTVNGYKTVFGVDYLNLNTGRDEQNYFIAYKRIKDGYTLVFMGLIGSQGQQWNSDFDPLGKESKVKSKYIKKDKKGYENNHHGFNDAKNYALEKLTKFMNDEGLNKSNAKILLTGHSRGAAATNLMAADLINKGDLVKKENLFTYTFATPNGTKDKNKNDSKYKGIFNIVFPTDFVTHVLLESWGYGKYGTTYKLPTGSNDCNYISYNNRMMAYYTSINPITLKDDSPDEEDLIKFNDYYHGTEANVNTVVNVMGRYVKNIDQFYDKKFTLVGSPGLPPFNLVPIRRMTPFEYFQIGLCPQVNQTKEKIKKATSIATMIAPLADTFISRGGSNLYKNISTFFILNQGINPSFADAHKMETYCSFLLALNANEVTQKRSAKKLICNCPVDIEVIDITTSQSVAKIKSNQVDNSIAGKDNALFADVNGDEKVVWLPSNGQYNIKLTGNDNGKMDYSVESVDPDPGSVSRTNYYEVAVVKGESYSSNISGTSVQLKDKTGKQIAADESFNADTADTYSIVVTADGRGSVTEPQTIVAGDYVTLRATPMCSEFAGWYENETLISTDIEYRFRPKNSMNIVAKINNERAHQYNTTVTKATLSASGTMVNICSVCGESNISTINKIQSIALTTSKYIYGGVRTPGVVVKDAKGVTLKKDIAYTVTYAKGRKNVGKYAVKVTFKGKYSGSKTLYFNIVPKGTSLTKLTAGKKCFAAKWKKLGGITGYQIQYSTKSNFSGAKLVTIKNSKILKTTVKKLSAKKVYYVRVRTYKTVSGTHFMSNWSKTYKVKTK